MVVGSITVKHELLKKGDRIRVRKFTRDGYDQFKIRLTISGPLSEIDHVEYELHPTFRNPIRTSKDRSSGFPIEFWTWGEFEVFVTAHFVDGHDETVTYELKYSSELSSDEAAYFDETPANLK